MAVRARRMRKNLRYIHTYTLILVDDFVTAPEMYMCIRIVHVYVIRPYITYCIHVEYLKYPASVSDKQETHVLMELSRTRTHSVYSTVRAFVRWKASERRKRERSRLRRTSWKSDTLENEKRARNPLWISSFSFSLPPFLSFSHIISVSSHCQPSIVPL